MGNLFICASPRDGSTEHIMRHLSDKTIFLRDLDIKHCNGCLYCREHNCCIIEDDMQSLYPRLLDSECLIIGTPNYFDNVPGILKDFIDRTNPLYYTKILKGKKLFVIVVGGQNVHHSRRVCDEAFAHFAQAHKMEFTYSYCFQAEKPEDLNKEEIDKVIAEIKGLIR